ncbi:uncharacterized protein LOC131220120 [Magnolia sinica]|uniref:uncharacterized protein LOC131220120 n=1 Tax=Magnolia sinica TaxID=86752 RepID=UPI00265A28CD|nr:uncharacterized protein LOC131220120 [Magnolia sinica]
MQGVRYKPFLASLDKNPSLTLAEFMARSDKYADAKETRIMREAAQNVKVSAKESVKKEVDSAGGKKHKNDRACDERKSGKRPDRKFSTYTPLNKLQEQVLMEIKGKGFVNCPDRLLNNPNRRSKNKYCLYHRDHRHNTSDCYHLKEEIERLIREGRLREHVKRTRTTEERSGDNRPIEEIRTIVGGPQGGGDSNNARKTYARSISRPESEILILSRPSKEKKREKYCISFTDKDARGIFHPHNDALVVTLTIANRKVFRILVNTGLSADVLFTQVFDKISVKRSTLRPILTPLIGFSGGQVLPEGVVSLPLTTGNSPQQATVMVDFLIVDQPYARIDPSVMTHRLNIDQTYRPIRQKRRPLGPERYTIIEEDVNKLLKDKFIEEIYYPKLIANVVLVKKVDGKWRVCIDNTDLNKACPKDSFPLPRID